jgi:hypothetical protein
MVISKCRIWQTVLASCLSFAAFGCEPKIGDACTVGTECNAAVADRICLTEGANQFPGGYCTSFNCGPTSCPDEALCVAYRSEIANDVECGQSGQSQRLKRSYCMLACDDGGDCRDGYACVSVEEGNPWGAVVLGGKSGKQKICAIAYTEPGTAEGRQNEVCVAASVDAAMPTPSMSQTAEPGDASLDGAVQSDASLDGAVQTDASLADGATLSDASTTDANAADSSDAN